MRKTQKPTTLSAEEVTHLSGKLLISLANAVAANEKAQRRFRTAVSVKLSKIETLLTMIHGAQIVEAHRSEPGGDDKAREHAKDAETFVSEKSQKLGLGMVRFIYDDKSDEPVERHDRRRKWSSWEI